MTMAKYGSYSNHNLWKIFQELSITTEKVEQQNSQHAFPLNLINSQLWALVWHERKLNKLTPLECFEFFRAAFERARWIGWVCRSVPVLYTPQNGLAYARGSSARRKGFYCTREGDQCPLEVHWGVPAPCPPLSRLIKLSLHPARPARQTNCTRNQML